MIVIAYVRDGMKNNNNSCLDIVNRTASSNSSNSSSTSSKLDCIRVSVARVVNEEK